MRFNLFFPAVALAVTTSSAVPALANAAPPLPAAPHSASSTGAPTTTAQPPRVVNSGVPKTSESAQHMSGKTETRHRLHIARTRAHNSRSTIRIAVKVLLDALNSVRQAKGLPLLSLDSRESKCSRLHSQHMALNGQISHDQFPTDVCVPYHYAAENVGFDPGSAPNAVLVLHNLMMREGPCAPSSCTGATYEQHAHYLNILNPVYRHVGIGIVVKRGATWLTEDFTT